MSPQHSTETNENNLVEKRFAFQTAPYNVFVKAITLEQLPEFQQDSSQEL